MKVCDEGKTLRLILEDSTEWDDIFNMNDGAYVDVFVDDLNIDLFFPSWRDYVDKDDVINTLSMEDADRFETLRIECGFDDANEEMKASEGDYIIEDFEQQEALDENDEVMIVGIDDPKDQIMMFTIYFTKDPDEDLR